MKLKPFCWSSHALILTAVLATAFGVAEAKPIRLRNEIITPEPRSDRSQIPPAPARENPVSGLYVVQFSGPVRDEWRSELTGLGVELLGYVPEDAFIANLNRVSPGQLRRLDYVTWLGKYRPEHKLFRELQSRPSTNAALDIAVLLSPSPDPAEENSVKQNFSLLRQEARYRFGHVLRGILNPNRLEQLAASEIVLWVEPAAEMKLYDEVSSRIVAGDGPLGQTLMQSLGYDGTGVTVAVADSGLDSGETNSMHPDIAGRVSALFYYGLPGQLDGPEDEHSHGTHVAGIIAGNGAVGETDDNGFLFGLGVAPGSSLIGQRIFDGLGNYAEPPSFEQLTGDARQAGADIGSNSWGEDAQGRYNMSAMEFDALVRDAVNDVYQAGDQQYIIEFSAGNAGPGDRTIGSPAVAKNVIATGAAQNDRPDLLIYGDGPDVMADFSSRGPCEDGRIKPDVTAPGTWIASLRSVYADDNNAWGEISPFYMYQGGTSQSGPHVSGAAAVFVQFWRESHTNATPSPALVKAALINSAEDMDETAVTNALGGIFDDEPLDTGFPVEPNPVPNMDEGWGRVMLPNLIGSTKDYLFVDQSALLTNSQDYEVRVLIGSSDEPLKITLAYTDVPGSPAAVSALVNDLDLEVFAPNGRVYRGNRFFAADSIPDALTPDNINNVEAVHLLEPVAGEYTIRIHARNVVMDARRDSGAVDQDFALVISGRFAPPGTGIVTFDRPVYTAPVTMNLRLVDYHLAGQPTAQISLRSTTETNSETITLHANGITGLFTGAVATATGPALSDGTLQIQHGDIITAIYQDALPPMQRMFVARADLLPPVISGVTVVGQFGRAQVYWDTDEPASSLVMYGTTPALGQAQTNTFLLTEHAAIPDGQVAGQTNYFRLVCRDEAGNVSTNDNAGMLFTYVVPFAPPILVVDGFYNDLLFSPPPIENYTDPLDQLGLQYDVWEIGSVETPDPPTAADLRTYRAVLWRIAEADTSRPTGLTSAEQATIREYLDSGGALFMASMELVSRLGITSPFTRDVLHVASFSEDVTVPEAEGLPNDSISDGMALEMSYQDYLVLGVLEFDASDNIEPGTGAEGFLIDSFAGDFVGVRFPRVGVDSPGRVVFLSFPFDAVPMSGPFPSNRTTLLRRILAFLAPGLNGQGNVAFNQSVYAVPSEAAVEVADSDLEGMGQISINVASDSQMGGFALNLQETQRRGVFRGSFAIVETNSGRLLPELIAHPGDDVHASYFDASSNATITVSVPVENMPPVVSSVFVEPGYVDAVVYWDTDELSDSLVEFGESTLLRRTALDTTPTDFHAVTLPQLTPNRNYYFRVISKDRAGNTFIDDNGGALYTFNTLAPLIPPWTDNLEKGITNWTVYTVDGSERGWELGVPGFASPAAHSPTNAWGSNLQGDYASAIESYLITPAILLTGGNKATLKFWHTYDFTMLTEYDIFHAGEVLLVTENALEPISLDVYFDDLAPWEEVEIDLTPYSGQLIYLAWHYFLFSFDSLPRTGWLIDDVSVTVTNVLPGTLTITNNIFQATYVLTGPTNLNGNGTGLTLTNAPPGNYTIQYGNVAHFEKPSNQITNLASGETINFSGHYTFADANTNNIPDSWEYQRFGRLDPSRTQFTDTDGDGLSDYQEFVAGTDPNNPPPPFKVTAWLTTNGVVQLLWPSVTNHTYRIHARRVDSGWGAFSDWFAAGGTNTTFVLPSLTNGAPNLFRVEAAATTSPNAEAPLFRLQANVTTNQQVRLEWPTAIGHGYRVLGSTNMVNWSPATDWLRASANKIILMMPATAAGPHFYRLEAAP